MHRIALFAIGLAACADTAGPLDETVEYRKEPSGPGSYEQCLAQPNNFGCEVRIRLCDDGTMAALSGDVYWSLTYAVHDGVAVGVDDAGVTQLHFDLEGLRSPELGDGWMRTLDGGILECLRF